MPTIVWPSSQEISIVDDIRDAIGREITFFVVASSVPCSACSLDPVTNESTNSFCPVCSGVYWIPIYSGVPIQAHITWGKSDQLGWVTGGEMWEGDCRVQIKYTPYNVTVVDSSKHVEVDGKGMEILSRTYRGVQQLNRIILGLLERDKNV